MSPRIYLPHDAPKYRHSQSLKASDIPAGEATGNEVPWETGPETTAAWAGMAAGSKRAADMVTAAKIRVLRVMLLILALISISQQVFSQKFMLLTIKDADYPKDH